MVEDALYEGPREGVHRQVFVAQAQIEFPGGRLVLRAHVGRSHSHVLGRCARRSANSTPRMPVYDMKTLDRQLDETLGTERLIAVLSACFGVLATLLAALGLYGVMAFVVARRTKEIGLRMALGAPQGSVVWMVLRETLVLLGIGLAIGIPARSC